MSDVDDLLTKEFKGLPPKPSDDATQAAKKRYSELMSAAAARALAEALRKKGLAGTLPLLGEPSRESTDGVDENGTEEEISE